MHEKIKKAVDIAQRAQRNYDLSKSIPKEDLETFVYSAVNSPSKQNETHYQLKIYTNQEIIKKIYDCTKRFSLIKNKEDIINSFEENKDGVFWQNIDTSVHNSQILSNVLFVYVDDDGVPRGGSSTIAQQTSNLNSESLQNYNNQKNFSIGISVGQLILSATLLGYKTGICSAFDPYAVQKVINTDKQVKLLVGIGYENQGIDRQLHALTKNKDVLEKFRNGNLEEFWRFPSFTKNIKVFIDDKQNFS
jgi:nitroreductase